MAVRRGEEVGQIPVRISYSFIRLFSEGLYRIPHKAVEELVFNSYDADAKNVRIVLPRTVTEGSGHSESPDSLWVVDDGGGMDESGFRDLWSVAVSRVRSIPLASAPALTGPKALRSLSRQTCPGSCSLSLIPFREFQFRITGPTPWEANLERPRS